jgi:hypothetical protein
MAAAQAAVDVAVPLAVKAVVLEYAPKIEQVKTERDNARKATFWVVVCALFSSAFSYLVGWIVGMR